MREETRKRLSRALLMQKLKWGGVAVVAVAALAVGFYMKNLDATVESTKPVAGTVVYVGPLAGKFRAVVAENNLQVDVKLDDARVAHLMVPRDKAPHIGDHLNIAEKIHGSGRHSFAWQ
jgi:hypothetical protein